MEKKRKKTTQCQRILEYLKQHGSITSWEAYSQLGVTQLSARITNLKDRGYVFVKERVCKNNRFNEKTRFDVYRLAEVQDEESAN